MLFMIVNFLSIFVFLGIAYLFSDNRKGIHWRSVITVVAIQLALAWFFMRFSIGQEIVQGAAEGFKWLVDVSNAGIAFALPDWLQPTTGFPNFVTSALLPMLMIVPFFDLLNYFGILPFVIKWIGRGLSAVTGQPKFEAFFSVEMMFLGNTEVLAVSKTQLNAMSARRNYTLALMSMSCVTASVIGAYTTMVPGKYVMAAIPLNILGAIVISSMLNPVDVPEEEDTIVSIHGDEDHREPVFSFIGDSILGAGRLILIITASVIGFVALAALVDALFSLTGLEWLKLQNIFGVVLFPLTWLLGFNVSEAFEIAQLMGMKLVTNEFVVMGEISKNIMAGTGLFANEHAKAVVTVFLTSFANFSTIGMILGAFKSLVSKEKSDYIANRVMNLLIAGILVSLLSAAIAGLFVW
ncbi:NupC/NupG family nucleoside CNT transporter [Weissella tructae]|jgi:purine nucleoside transport protein|uniref:Purine nucleoside transport protein n=2 Tax=Weissella TaxID=46255 RepID=A0A075U0M4_9LACO|nr:MULTISPECIES: nucleoside transporter C-terminal domain-containing protein [Weissella]AIG66090.1 Purine nucleoside transport protein [Weissella tructae]AIM63470.1 Purine nucleoside transport protein [Weissella ceti]AIM64805.1 Purine nucleoside transport protein [Weissella ceti]ELA07462.1 nucleoside permease [Weissella ceti NC36]QVV91240.1 NupC/NupG family nucleoside CNT transporter [Weissella tructae]